MSRREKWTVGDVPDQAGRTAIVTGANSGIGFETARALSSRGAKVILACRDIFRGRVAARRITDEYPGANAKVRALDLANLQSVREFAADFTDEYQSLNLLVNNAGVMIPPLGRTRDGYELQMGINHLGHFALTALLVPFLLDQVGSRVVTVSSLMHKSGAIDFDDLFFERKKYKKWKAYSHSKLANLLFTLELQRRLQATDSTTLAVAAHPGWTNTELQKHSGFATFFNPLLAMNAQQGALPTLHAATAPDVEGGQYFGPGGLFELKGAPIRVGMSEAARNEETASRLWSISEELTGVEFPKLDAPAP